ncbi:MAG: acyl-CoA dehydrogenase family protein [Polyangiaceae bacterium]|nr:acyl-CoA dehydrogenase family protein [Polyangiaceae bacterium]
MPTPLTLNELSAIDGSLTEEERQLRASVRRLVAARYAPRAAALFENEEFPSDLIDELAGLGLLGAGLEGYGCAGLGAVAYGMILQELEYGDSALRSFVSVQGSLAMQAIHSFGDESQKQRWLPEMASGKLIGCFGLTEPDSGSDPASMRTVARKDGDDYILNGTKMWITNSPIAHVAVVWAKTDARDAKSVTGFVVERDSDGFETPTITGKMSLRASVTGEIVLNDVRVPSRQMLAGKRGLGAPLACLSSARFGISWGALGAARACLESTISYTRERKQFGVPIARKQLVQAEIADMASSLITGELLALHMGRIKERGELRHEQISLCKRNNVAAALDIARRCRALLGANGILLDYPVIRHMLNLESVITYEGTHEVHTLVLGRALTGEDAF